MPSRRLRAPITFPILLSLLEQTSDVSFFLAQQHSVCRASHPRNPVKQATVFVIRDGQCCLKLPIWNNLGQKWTPVLSDWGSDRTVAIKLRAPEPPEMRVVRYQSGTHLSCYVKSADTHQQKTFPKLLCFLVKIRGILIARNPIEALKTSLPLCGGKKNSSER